MFYQVVLVKFYCDVITRTRLQLINTFIDTFFIKFCAFLMEQGKPMMIRKLDGAVHEFSPDQEICNSMQLYITCEKLAYT